MPTKITNETGISRTLPAPYGISVGSYETVTVGDPVGVIIANFAMAGQPTGAWSFVDTGKTAPTPLQVPVPPPLDVTTKNYVDMQVTELLTLNAETRGLISTIAGHVSGFTTIAAMQAAPSLLDSFLVQGYVSSGDGGGGVFIYEPGSAETVDNGLIFSPPNGLTGRVKRVYSGTMDVRWFGAKGDAVADDTVAIQAAFTAAAQRAYQTSSPDGASSTAVFFPQGVYLISDAINVCQPFGPSAPPNGYWHVVGYDQPIIKQTNAAKKIFSSTWTGSTAAHTISVKGITFWGGTNHLYFESSESASDAKIIIDECEFANAADYAIKTALAAGATHYDGALLINKCRFVSNQFQVYTVCDHTSIRDCWVNPKGVSSLVSPPDAMFVNKPSAGAGGMSLEDCEMVGPIGTKPGSGTDYCRWVSNYGSFSARRVKFGGEGAGMPIVHHYTSPTSIANGYAGDTVVIEDCGIYCDTPYLDDEAVLVLVDGAPQIFSYMNNRGPVDPGYSIPIVKVPSFGAVHSAGLQAYLASHSSTRFHYRIQSDLQAAGNPFPYELLPYVNLLESSPLLTGAQKPDTISGTVCTKTYAIPPALSIGFALLVTVSINPNNQGSVYYRTSATYLVHMTTGYTSHGVVNVLSVTPLAQPGTPGVGVDFPSMDVTFPDSPGGWGDAHQISAGTATRIAISWDSGHTGVAATYGAVTVVPLHGSL